VAGQDVGWDKGGTIRAGDYKIFYGNLNENNQFGTENMCICWYNNKY
jgi:hypothetical protein